jgi:putative toxin-antitoxin system antitoxin component (TIGR02293 family)
MAKPLSKQKHRKTVRSAAKASKFVVVARKRRKVIHGPKSSLAAALGLRTDDVVEILGSIESGLPFNTLRRFQERVDLPWNEVAELIQIKPRTLTRRRVQRRLQPDESDRIVRVSRIFEQAAELFEGDLDAARRWLSSPQKAFAGSTPFAFAKTDLGAREVENVIGRLEHGVFA